jgi:hypothetical protein
MRIIRKLLFGIAVVTSTLLTAAFASASERSDSLRQGVKNIEERTSTVRGIAEKLRPTAQRETAKIVKEVDRHRHIIEARIAVLELLAPLDKADDRTMKELEATLAKTDRTLAIVERWFGLHE